MSSKSAKNGIEQESGAVENRLIALVVYPGVTLLDVAGPAQVFATANDRLAPGDGGPRYRPVLVSPSGGEIDTDTGISVRTLATGDLPPDSIDTLIVAGGNGVFSALDEGRLIAWIKACHRVCRRVASTCMGAFLTAEAGLLSGQCVTTHWRYSEELQNRHPDLRVERDPLFVRSGKIWSSAGVTAGIDLALAMVEEDHGHALAMQVAQALVVFFKRPGGQAQFSPVLLAQSEDGGGLFAQLHAWMAGNLANDLRVETLARWAGMSPRTFARLYKAHTGTTPAKSVECLRVDAAKRLLEQGGLPMAKVARQTGLVDLQRLRRAFLRHVGVSPADYQRRFCAMAGD